MQAILPRSEPGPGRELLEEKRFAGNVNIFALESG
jgi:hypothetical protein